MNQNLYSSRLLEFLRIFKNLAPLGIHLKNIYSYTLWICQKIYIKPFPWNLWVNIYEILCRWSTRGFQHTLMLFGQMCHQWWSHLFLIGSLTSIQLQLGFQRKFAERKYSTCSKSSVYFSCCSVYKDDRLGFWLADTLSDSLQPGAYNLYGSVLVPFWKKLFSFLQLYSLEFPTIIFEFPT